MQSFLTLRNANSIRHAARLRLAPRIGIMAIASLGLLLLISDQASANDWGSCGSRIYSGSYGHQYRVNHYRTQQPSCNRVRQVYSGYDTLHVNQPVYRPRPVQLRPVLALDAVGWTYRCDLGDYGCQGYYHPEYQCWYYFYPQQQVFLPVDYIAQYPPVHNQNLNDNFNRNDNFNTNDNRNNNTNITNINIGPGATVSPDPATGDVLITPEPVEFVPGNPVPQIGGPAQQASVDPVDDRLSQLRGLPQLPQLPANQRPPLPQF